jgi:hypothetical protein
MLFLFFRLGVCSRNIILCKHEIIIVFQRLVNAIVYVLEKLWVGKIKASVFTIAPYAPSDGVGVLSTSFFVKFINKAICRGVLGDGEWVYFEVAGIFRSILSPIQNM